MASGVSELIPFFDTSVVATLVSTITTTSVGVAELPKELWNLQFQSGIRAFLSSGGCHP